MPDFWGNNEFSREILWIFLQKKEFLTYFLDHTFFVQITIIDMWWFPFSL